MEVVELFTKVKHEDEPYPDRVASEEFIMVTFRFTRSIGSRSSRSCPTVWLERTPLGSASFWFKLRRFQSGKLRRGSSLYRTKCINAFKECLSNLGVPEVEHSNAIGMLLDKLDAAVSTELPIDVSVVDMTLFMTDDESLASYQPIFVAAARSSIEALETVKLDHDFRSDPCVMCLEDFSADQNLIHLPGSDYYHQLCILQSLEISHLCPLCRHPMPPETQDC